MKLKRYNDFKKVNESFTSSNEFKEFLKDHSLSNSFFSNSLLDVSDIDNTDISIYRHIIDGDGNSISKFDSNLKYFIKYTLIITYDFKFDKVDSFFKSINKLNDIKLSIDEMKSRVLDEGLNFVSDKVELSPTRNSGLDVYIKLIFKSDEINSELKLYCDKYDSHTGKEYNRLFDNLRKIYTENGIDFDKHVDILEPEDGDVIVSIGIIAASGDLYHIADYFTDKNEYTIHYDDVKDSIDDFKEHQ